MDTDMSFQNRLRERVRDYLALNRISQTAFAKQIGRPKSTVSMFLSSKRNLDIRLVVSACHIIGISLAELDSAHRGPDPARLSQYKDRLGQLYGVGGPGFDAVAYSIDSWLAASDGHDPGHEVVNEYSEPGGTIDPAPWTPAFNM